MILCVLRGLFSHGVVNLNWGLYFPVASIIGKGVTPGLIVMEASLIVTESCQIVS